MRRSTLEEPYETYYREIISPDFRGLSRNGMVFVSLEELTYYLVNMLTLYREFISLNRQYLIKKKSPSLLIEKKDL